MNQMLPTRCIVSRANRVVLAPDTSQTRTLLPGGVPIEHLGQRYVAVPHDISSTVCLRTLGHTVPNPMLTYYDWQGASPFAVQRATCDLLTTNPRSYVLNAMGTGKTRSALWAWDYLYGEGIAGKALIVATLSTLHIVWGKECFETVPWRKVAVLHGTKTKRLEALNSDADIFVINHDGLRTIEADIAKREDISVLILDELAVYRNNSIRSKAMRKFSARFPVVWGLTGAPMPNQPTDVWAQAKIITPNTVPKYFRQAEEMLMNRIDKFRLVPKPNAVETAFNMLQPSVRYSLDDVTELPELVHHTLDIPLTKEQKDVYEKLSKAFQADIEGKRVTAVNAAVAMGKLLQVSGGWVYAAGETAALDNSPRVETLIDLINGNDRKVIIFASFIHTIEGLSPLLEKTGIEHGVVHGDIPSRRRAEIFTTFQNTDKYKALLAHPACMAHGLTLTAANMIIWYSPVTSLDIYDQANARITRVGQRHRQNVYHLQSTSVERRIYRLLKTKSNVQNELLTMLANATNDAA